MTDAELRKKAEAAMPSQWTYEQRRVLALLDRIDAVRALHEMYEDGAIRYCGDCSSLWPCPTIRALDGES